MNSQRRAVVGGVDLAPDEIRDIKKRIEEACDPKVSPGQWGEPADRVTKNSEAYRLINEVERLRGSPPATSGQVRGLLVSLHMELEKRADEIERILHQPISVDPNRDLAALLTRQFEWSEKTFGEGYRMKALLAHIRKELDEIEADPDDPVEWIDVALLALDGAWRCKKITGTSVAELMVAKMAKNRVRKWSVVRGDEPIEHVRDDEGPEFDGAHPLVDSDLDNPPFDQAANPYAGLTVEQAWAKCESEPRRLNGLSCSVCGSPQFITPGGPSCVNQHGGAEGVDAGAGDVDVPQDDNPLDFSQVGLQRRGGR